MNKYAYFAQLQIIADALDQYRGQMPTDDFDKICGALNKLSDMVEDEE